MVGMASLPRYDGKFSVTTSATARGDTGVEILANGTAVLTQRARQPGRIDKGDEGESSLDEIKTSCEFESSTIIYLFAVVWPHNLNLHALHPPSRG